MFARYCYINAVFPLSNTMHAMASTNMSFSSIFFSIHD